jgi:hypothetical protein
MRMIGRVSAPLFWFCFAEGYRHTHNRAQYAIRLAAASIAMSLGNNIMMLASGLTLNISPIFPNMFFTFLLMTGLITCLEKIKTEKTVKQKIMYVVLSLALAITIICAAEYGLYALSSILIFYFIKKRLIKYAVFAIINIILCLYDLNIIQLCMIASIPFLIFSTDARPRHSAKSFFYIFYPLHLWVIMIIAIIL